MRFFYCFLLFNILYSAAFCFAATDTYPFADGEQQQRFQRLSEQLRCVVCQNESLAESDAPLAHDLRKQIYNMLQQQKTDQQITAYLVSRYGEFVLLKPIFSWKTAGLWLAPFALLFGGFFLLFIHLKKH